MFNDIQRERRITTLQKAEGKLKEKINKGGCTLNDIKEDLQICTMNYLRIKALNMITRQLMYLEERGLQIEKDFKGELYNEEARGLLRNIGWGLYKCNSDNTQEFLNFFMPLTGDVTKMDNYIDRQVI